MDKDYIEQGVDFNCLPEIVFKAWLDSKQHGEMIDGNAKIEPIVGGNFSIWDASITGITTKIDKRYKDKIEVLNLGDTGNFMTEQLIRVLEEKFKI